MGKKEYLSNRQPELAGVHQKTYLKHVISKLEDSSFDIRVVISDLGPDVDVKSLALTIKVGGMKHLQVTGTHVV